jgi:hypothetical protein
MTNNILPRMDRGGATAAACMKVPGVSAIGYCSEAGRSVRLQVKMLAILGN